MLDPYTKVILLTSYVKHWRVCADHTHVLLELTKQLRLLALMLGRLKLSIAQCEKAYDDIAKAIFGKQSHWSITTVFGASSYLYDGKKLEDAVKALCKEHLLDENAQMLDESNPCKVSVYRNFFRYYS